MTLKDGRRLEADLYIDATGLDARLIGEALGAAWEDASRWLPCVSLAEVVAPTEETPAPVAQAQALEAGWRWRVAAQGRASIGLVWDSARLDDAAAAAALGPGVEPRLTRFRSGRRVQAWRGNCVAVGLSAGVLEPLEPVGLHLVQAAITRLIDLFPDRNFAPCLAQEHNRLTASTFERARDFLALHYHTGVRPEPFWRERQAETLPEALAWKLEVFAARGRVVLYDEETFPEASWLSVLIGQGVIPARYDPLIDGLEANGMQQRLQVIAAMIRQGAEAMPSHGDTLARILGG